MILNTELIDKEQSEIQMKLFAIKVISNPTRQRIIGHIGKGNNTTSKIYNLRIMPQTIRLHLNILLKAGFLSKEKNINKESVYLITDKLYEYTKKEQ